MKKHKQLTWNWIKTYLRATKSERNEANPNRNKNKKKYGIVNNANTKDP